MNKLTIVCIADSDRQAGSPPGSGPENPSVRSLFDTADTLAQGNRPVFSNTLLTWSVFSSFSTNISVCMYNKDASVEFGGRYAHYFPRNYQPFPI